MTGAKARCLAALLSLAAATATSGCGSPTHSMQRVAYPSGQTRWEFQARDGVPHGTSHTYHPDGAVRSVGAYRNGRKHGLFIYYDAQGRIESKTYFWRHVAVWTSTDRSAEPPPELIAGLMRMHGAESEAPPDEAEMEVSSPGLLDRLKARFDQGPPRAHFSSLDRTTPLTRFGVQLGAGGSAQEDATVERATIFGNYVVDAYSVFAQLDGSRVRTTTDEVGGRSTLEVSAGHHRRLAGGWISPRVGVILPVGNDDQDGYMPSAAASYQRPADAVATLPSTVALRGAASYTRSGPGWVLQGDGGVDLAAGGAGGPVRPFGRANAALGIGARSLMGMLELSNTLRLDDLDQRLHAIGVGGALWLGGVWTTALLSRTSGGHITFAAGAGYAF